MISNVILRHMWGGLGNHMFLAAYALNLKAQGIRVKLYYPDPPKNLAVPQPVHSQLSFSDLKAVFPKLELPLIKQVNEASFVTVSEVNFNKQVLDERFDTHKLRPKFPYSLRCMMQGYYMGEPFFAYAKDKIRTTYCFNETNPALTQLIEVLEKDEQSVAVHVRRTDFLTEKHFANYNVCTPEYYQQAISRMQEKLRGAHFYVFSDDFVWCREHMPSIAPTANFSFIDASDSDGYSSWWDMCLMSHAHHNIIANSSYSWWAAWLNAHTDKLVLCPDRWDNGFRGIFAGREYICAAGWEVCEPKEGHQV